MVGIRNAADFLRRYRQDITVILGGLAIFLALMAAFALTMFPEGQRLGELGGDERGGQPSSAGAPQELSYGSASAPSGMAVARLTRVVRTVEHRGGSEVVWNRASTAMMLAHRDAVQTKSRSIAFIDFNEGGELRLAENSLVVIRESASDPFAGLARPAVVMVRGSLSGALDAGAAAGLDVETPAGVVSLGRGTDASDTLQFALGVDDENSTRISIVGGEAELVLDGRRTVIGASEALTIDAAGRVVRHRVPSSPRLLRPTPDAVVAFGGTAPTIKFRWEGEGADTYRLRVARDEAFDNVLIEERTERGRHQLAALRPGTYWWRVSGIVDGHEGPASTARELLLVRDTTPPKLAIEPLPDRVGDGAVTLRGSATPGARVYVRGEPVEAGPDGRFEHVLSVSPGTNIVVVEAVDGLGNVAFASATVTSKRTMKSE